MSELNNPKRQPWTNDPEVLKQVWGKTAEVKPLPYTAAQRLVLQRGSIWPTSDELSAYKSNALPDAQTFNREPIQSSAPYVKPERHTPIASRLTEVKVMDNAQQIIDDVLSLKEDKSPATPAPKLAEPIFIPVTPVAQRMKEAQDKLIALKERFNKA